MEKKTLIAYFSCSGRTKARAGEIQGLVQGDLVEIKPKKAYSKEDLNWKDKESRSSLEMADPKSRPEVEALEEKVRDYDRLLIGFPIWWGVAPHAILSVLDQEDLGQVEIYPFASSGASPIEPAVENLKGMYGDKVNIKAGRLFNTEVTKEDLEGWLE